MAKFDVPIPSQVPGFVPSELFTAFNDLYMQLTNLQKQLNTREGILQSPDGHYWRVNVSNLGVLTTTDLGTVLA